jgi:hypothetical protein
VCAEEDEEEEEVKGIRALAEELDYRTRTSKEKPTHEEETPGFLLL